MRALLTACVNGAYIISSPRTFYNARQCFNDCFCILRNNFAETLALGHEEVVERKGQEGGRKEVEAVLDLSEKNELFYTLMHSSGSCLEDV